MSAYTELETCFTDVPALVEALKEFGYTAEVHATAKQLIGYHGDLRADTAEIIIPRSQIGGVSNDIGFKRQANGTYAAIISEFDSCKHNAEWRKKLNRTYAEKEKMRLAAKAGLRFVGKQVINGKIRLQFLQA